MDKLVVKRIEAYQAEIPGLYHEMEGSLVTFRTVLVRAGCRFGGKMVEGWGEGAPGDPAHTGQTLGIASEDIEQRIAPLILEKEIGTASDITEFMEEARGLRYGMGCAVTAVDAALFCAFARAFEAPIYKLIREQLWLPPLELKDSLKINLCGKTIPALELFGKAENVPDEGRFILDARESLVDEDEFVYLLGNVMKKFPNVKIVIQPFRRDRPHVSSRLVRKLKDIQSGLKVYMDSGAATLDNLDNVLLSKAADGAVIRYNRDGGYSGIIEKCEFLKDVVNFDFFFRSTYTTSIGAAANIHAILGVKDFLFDKYGHDLKPPVDFEFTSGKPFIKSPPFSFKFKDGGLDVLYLKNGILKQPGLGVTPDFDQIERFITVGMTAVKSGEAVTIHKFPYKKGRPDTSRVERTTLEP